MLKQYVTAQLPQAKGKERAAPPFTLLPPSTLQPPPLLIINTATVRAIFMYAVYSQKPEAWVGLGWVPWMDARYCSCADVLQAEELSVLQSSLN
jgi:hypothetical protein